MPEEKPLSIREEHHVTEEVDAAVAKYPFAEDAFWSATWRIAREPECGKPVTGTNAYPSRRVVHIQPLQETSSSPGILIRYYRLPNLIVIDWVHFYPFNSETAVRPDAYSL